MELPPSRLFKYFSLSGEYESHSKQLLTDCEIFYSSPAAFNDPFDCSLAFSSEGTKEQWIKHMKQYLGRQNPKMTPMKRLETARRFTSEGRHNENRRDLTAKVAASWHVYCLSAQPDDILMWSHYADKHRGYVIEFNSELPHLPFCSALKVSYPLGQL
jgi:hypothetical protein